MSGVQFYNSPKKERGLLGRLLSAKRCGAGELVRNGTRLEILWMKEKRKDFQKMHFNIEFKNFILKSHHRLSLNKSKPITLCLEKLKIELTVITGAPFSL